MAKTFQDFVRDAQTRIREVSAEDVLRELQRGEPLVVLDVREPEEYQRGHLPGAISIPRGVIEGQAPQILRDPGAAIVVYCASGMRSALAADTLQQMGYASLRSMAGGFRSWSQIGGPAER
jgi:sulfur-carrier protein adenylyltransferase/sulfurtransferase